MPNINSSGEQPQGPGQPPTIYFVFCRSAITNSTYRVPSLQSPHNPRKPYE
jgi:hypothetical protein